ncbi:hypothetical protein BH09MYX1_BH09MYX1_34150 [soil metagenome]
MKKRGLWLGVVGAMVIVLAACGKPKAGGDCKTESEVKCTDDKNALVCTSGKWEALPCRGLNGCMSMMGSPGTCTNDGFKEGEPCPGDEGNPNCSADKKAMLKCVDKHWKKQEDCNGQHGCVSNAKGTNCDMGTADVGSTCTAANEGNVACAPDKKSELVCEKGKMGTMLLCKGMHGCRQMGDKIECDHSLADVGDDCEGTEPACTLDKKNILACKDGKFTKVKACSCAVFLDEIKCMP